MIDIENQLFDRIAYRLRDRYGTSDLFIVGDTVKAPSQFPCVSIVEIDNASYQNTIDSGSNENHALVTYEVNVYSNRRQGRKRECKEIVSFVDREFTDVGFRRRSLNQTKNEDQSIYRMTARYSAVVSEDHTIYRG